MKSLKIECVIFERNPLLIDFNKLRTNEIETINFDNYISIDLNVDMVLKALFEKDDPHYELDFPKDRLISDSFMDDLICFVNDGNKIAPPILELVGQRVIIRDGKHRLGLMRFLNIQTIPFLVLKSNIENYKYLT